jgi:hypothetical protein
MARRSWASAAVIVALAVALAGVGSSAASGASSRSLSGSACFLLDETKLAVTIRSGHPLTSSTALNDSCGLGSCWTQVTDPDTGAQSCTYRRETLLTLGVLASASAARADVRRLLAKGYKKLAIKHADLAGVVSDASGGAVVMAVGRNKALLTLGATGPGDSHAPWAKAKALLLRAAKLVAGRLHQRGCPLRTAACG